MMHWGWIAALVSAAGLITLAWRDPKRLRNALPHPLAVRSATAPLQQPERRIVTLLVIAPGALLALAGCWAAFLIWLGASCALGWLGTQVLSAPTRTTRRAR